MRPLQLRIVAAVLFILLALPYVSRGETWIDPHFDVAVRQAALVLTGRVDSAAGERMWMRVDAVYRGSAGPGDRIPFGLAHSHSHSGDEDDHSKLVGQRFVVILKKGSGGYVTATPSFGIYLIDDDTVYLPLKDALTYNPVPTVELDALLRGIQDTSYPGAEALAQTAASELPGLRPLSKVPAEVHRQATLLMYLARWGTPQHEASALPFLRSPYHHLRWAAVEAVAHCRGPRGSDVLTAMLETEESGAVQSVLGKALYTLRPAGAKDVLAARIPETSPESIHLAESIMNPVFNTLPPPRHALAAALMRLEGFALSYDSLLRRAEAYLTQHPTIKLPFLEGAKTYYRIEDARKARPDSVLILSITDEEWKSLPSEILHYKNLRKLSLYDCGLTSLPDSLALLTSLEELAVSRDSLGKIPPVVFKLKTLRRLTLYDTELDTLDARIGELTGLEELEITSSDDIQHLPATICLLQNLRVLNLRMAGLSTLPSCISSLPKLREIELYGNNFSSFPSALLQSASLRSVDLSQNALHILPADLSGMKRLQYLDVSYNRMTRREAARIARGYEGISINTENDRNRFYSVEDALEIPALARDVEAAGNDYNNTTLPFERLTHTTYLGLESCNLSAMPEAICKMPHLKYLRLSKNKLTVLPACLAAKDSLKSLDLDDNPLGTLPDQIKDLKQLESLSIAGCGLTVIPAWIKSLPVLNTLSIGRNPLPAALVAEMKQWAAGRNVTLFVD